MSILIRGMEMPQDCPHCEFAAIGYPSPMSSDCTLYCRAVDKFKDCATAVLENKPYEVINHYNSRPDWCPISEFVQCMNCKHYLPYEVDGTEGKCKRYSRLVTYEDYCSYGERRTE